MKKSEKKEESAQNVAVKVNKATEKSSAQVIFNLSALAPQPGLSAK